MLGLDMDLWTSDDKSHLLTCADVLIQQSLFDYFITVNASPGLPENGPAYTSIWIDPLAAGARA